MNGDRLERALSQTMTITSFQKAHGKAVLKSSRDKSVRYTVGIGTKPSCECNDFGQGNGHNICTDTYFVL